MTVFQLWWDDMIGPIFATEELAIKFLKEDTELEEADYPEILEIVIGDTNFSRDR